MLAVIPARAGSKRIPGKNIKDFHGRPVLSYTIQAAQRSGLFNNVVVSTESREIAEIAACYGAEINERPVRLAKDNTPIIDVVRYVADEYAANGRKSETIVLLYAAQPMLDPDILRDAAIKFDTGDRTRPLLSITKEDGERFYDAGMFCFYDAAHIKRENFRFYRVPGAIDLNTPEDWVCADIMFANMKGN